MAAATGGYEWSHSSPLRSSPDTASPMYPDRPIRPMPKRRLRDRMSPEQAETIEFPPHPPSAGPLFRFPYSNGERVPRSLRQGESDYHACHCGHNHSEVESDEEEEERGAPLASSPSYHYSRSVPVKAMTGGALAYSNNKSGSTASSVDGYESFENTNNKKKRKIPNMGGTNLHHTSLSTDMASMGISHPHSDPHDGLEEGDGPGRYYSSLPSTPQHNSAGTGISSAGTGISGAGRGRFGRVASGRAERRVLGNSTNLANAKASSKRPLDHQAGIISTAIAKAQAAPSPPGSENVSLLQQEASRPSANKTQFTFTCGSDSATKMVWPGQENGHYPQPPGAYPTSSAPPPSSQTARARPPVRGDAPTTTHATQTSPSMPSTNRNAPAQKSRTPTQQPPPPPKPRRSPSKLYAYAARKRRIQQEYTNLHNPPDPAWICEFCEYEDIFGAAPFALIRQYEIKDRKERRKMAEKRRLLEKARMKGRKGKKASKKANSANNAQQNRNPTPPGGYDGNGEDGSLDDQGEEYYDEYDDLPPQQNLPSRQCAHAGCHHHHHQPPLAPGDPRTGLVDAM